MPQLSENTKVTTNLKFIIMVIGFTLTLAGTYYNLVGQVNELKNSVEKFKNYPSANEINMKNELIRQTVISNKELLTILTEKVDIIDDRLYKISIK